MNFNLSKSKETGVKYIGGAVILALIAAGGAYYTISGITAKVPIYVAKQSISKGDPLSENHFKVVYLPKGGIPEDALTPDVKLDSRISNKDMSVDDILRKVNTIDLKYDNPPLLSARLKVLEQSGLVGGEIPIDSIQGMLDGMKSGDKVYVVGVTKEVKRQNGENETIEEVKGETVVESAIVVGVKGGGEDGKTALIIAMSKEDAVKLAVAREKGKVYAYLLPFGQGSMEDINK